MLVGTDVAVCVCVCVGVGLCLLWCGGVCPRIIGNADSCVCVCVSVFMCICSNRRVLFNNVQG